MLTQFDTLLNGPLDRARLCVRGDDGLDHAILFDGSTFDGGPRIVMTRCAYGRVRSGKDALLGRGAPTCIACMAT